jgi:uncharacterized cupredoxin-like copper-binding protein
MARIRIGLLAVVATCALGAWALPAAAGHRHGSNVPRATSVTVTAGKPSEFRFTLSKKSVASQSTVTFKVSNKGSIPHDFKIAGKKTKLISPGQSASLKISFKKAGKYPYLCTVPGHAAAGMKGTLIVK